MIEIKKDKGARRAMRKETVKMKAAGFWDILSDAVDNFGQNSDGNQAAAIALYAILSAVPLIVLTIFAAGSFFNSNPNIQTNIITAVQSFHPYFSEDILKQLGHIESNGKILGWVGILALVWLSAAIFNSIESSLNIIFRARRKRHYVVSKLIAIGMIPTAWLIGALSVTISYAAALLSKAPLVLPGDIEISLSFPAQIVLRYIIPYLMVVIFIAAVYRLIPTVKIRLSVILAGSMIFAFLLEIAKQFFTWYITNYARYHDIFGSLETVVILIVWVFYVALIFFFCAEMLSSYERRDILLWEKALLKSHHSRLKVDERLFRKFGHVFPKGSIVFKEGDPGGEMFYILSGRVCLERTDCQIKKTLAEMGPGQYFGEMATLIDVRRTATARVLEDSHLAVIDEATFRNLISESRDVALSMLREFSIRLKNSNAALEDFTSLWSRVMIIMYFLDQAEPVIEEHIPLLAERTGKSPGEIRVLISGLADQGVLIVKEGLILEVDRENMWPMFASGTIKNCYPSDKIDV